VKGYLLAGIISVVFLTVTIRAIRKKLLTEALAILWLLVSIATVLLSAMLPFGALTPVAHFFGIAYPPDMVLVFGMLFLVLFTFQVSVAISRLSTNQKKIVQELALLQARRESEHRDE
jgi:hypothetical protein